MRLDSRHILPGLMARLVTRSQRLLDGITSLEDPAFATVYFSFGGEQAPRGAEFRLRGALLRLAGDPALLFIGADKGVEHVWRHREVPRQCVAMLLGDVETIQPVVIHLAITGLVQEIDPVAMRGLLTTRPDDLEQYDTWTEPMQAGAGEHGPFRSCAINP